MSRDPLDTLSRELFAAARREPAPEATQRRIAALLRAGANRKNAAGLRRTGWPAARVWVAVAAAALATAAIVLAKRPVDSVQISAEALPIPVADTNVSEKSTAAPVPAPAPPSASAVETVVSRPVARRAPARAPASLEQELLSIQQARAALGRGDAPAALAELDRFGEDPGWRQLAVEASLLRIEALYRSGRSSEARQLASRFVEQHPNNPLVDRARTFVTPPVPAGAQGLSKESGP